MPVSKHHVSSLKMSKKDSLAHLHLSTEPAKVVRPAEQECWQLGWMRLEDCEPWLWGSNIDSPLPTLRWGEAWNSEDMVLSSHPHCYYLASLKRETEAVFPENLSSGRI